MNVRKWFSNTSEKRGLLRVETRLKLELLKNINIAEQQINDGRGIQHSDIRARMLEHFETANHMLQAPQRSHP
jgi:flagella basal body P-ring formation protein FlgA